MSFYDLLSCRDTLIGKYDAAISAKGDISELNQLIHICAHVSLIDVQGRTRSGTAGGWEYRPLCIQMASR